MAGALVVVLPFFWVTSRLITNFLTSSSLERPKNLRILVAARMSGKDLGNATARLVSLSQISGEMTRCPPIPQHMTKPLTPLGAEPLGEDVVGETGNVGLALLDDDGRDDTDVNVVDGSSDGLPLALAGAAGAVARVAGGEEEAGTVGEEDTLLHRETPADGQYIQQGMIEARCDEMRRCAKRTACRYRR
jgi:hypothetical protein